MERPWLTERVRVIPDHPEPGVNFRDLTTVFAAADTFGRLVDELAAMVEPWAPEAVVGIEARGFIVGAPVARQLGIGFIPVRKPDKLPAARHRVDYALEYGSDALEIHIDGASEGQRLAVIDDLLATGGTAAATVELIRRTGAEPVGVAVVMELLGLEGRARVDGVPVAALIAEAA